MSRMPQVTGAELIRFLLRRGFVIQRQTGSHVHLRDASRSVLVTVPMHQGRDLGRGLAQSILKEAGFSVDDYLRLR